jgi:hypothetical protein
MYKRSKKDDYHKRIEEMIGGSQKHSRKSFDNSSKSDNNNINISDTTSVININNGNDDASSDINDSSSGINDNAKNEICIQRWNSVGTRVEGIRKYLEANKINLNNLIIKLL